MSAWHDIALDEAVRALDTDIAHGLSREEAARRAEQYGLNALVEKPTKSIQRILWEQLSATLVVILIVASVASALLGDFKDAAAILVIVVLNGFLGVREEYRAEQAMAGLKRLSVPVVRLRRGGHVVELPAVDLVPGDVALLEAGNLVPADGRLVESANLRIDEAALTGESEPVEKDARLICEKDVALADRRNMAYMGTTVTYGRGLLVITETGMSTQLGRIADLLQTVQEERTPLQGRLDQLGRVLVVVALGIVGVIFVSGLVRGEDLRLLFLTAVSLAVAAVPEGLPAVVTVALALGSQRMLRRHALIRKLPAVETLGSVTVICSDKTGTLTQNRMTVAAIVMPGRKFDVGGVAGFEAIHEDPRASLLLAAGALCNDAVLESDSDDDGRVRVVGDPTEGALVWAAARGGLEKSHLEDLLPRVDEVPFDSDRKRMSTVHRLPGRQVLPAPLDDLSWGKRFPVGITHLVAAKGAIDSVLEVATRVWLQEEVAPLDQGRRERIRQQHDELAQNGMRVLAVAVRGLSAAPIDAKEIERDLDFLGLVAMIDPPRPEVHDAIETCESAGLRTLMITGDHPLTAAYIARELGLPRSKSHLLTGRELDRLSADELSAAVEDVNVYARVSPEHKLNIVDALQQHGQIVAMTGDGVNDAPALKKADIGVAMGITGTDVSKEASDMVLQDDNFSTIVAAVEEGRIIFDNIRKFIKYLLSCNSGELWVMLVGPILGMPLPLLPLQILWMNLITDGLPALALGVEPAERDTMLRPPHPSSEGIFARGVGRDIVWLGLLMGVSCLALGYGYWRAGRGEWQTVVFATLTFSQMFLALGVRSERDSLFGIGLLSNKPMLGAVTLSLLLQLVVIYLPAAQEFFDTQALSFEDLGLAFLVSTGAFWAYELNKWIVRRRQV
jgi:Ca2+-transporting ATPase